MAVGAQLVAAKVEMRVTGNTRQLRGPRGLLVLTQTISLSSSLRVRSLKLMELESLALVVVMLASTTIDPELAVTGEHRSTVMIGNPDTRMTESPDTKTTGNLDTMTIAEVGTTVFQSGPGQALKLPQILIHGLSPMRPRTLFLTRLIPRRRMLPATTMGRMITILKRIKPDIWRRLYLRSTYDAFPSDTQGQELIGLDY